MILICHTSIIYRMEKIEIESLVDMADKNGQSLIEKFSISSLISHLDRSLLQSIENIYRMKEDGLDIIEFTRFFMNCIEHQDRQSLFLATSLHELFAAIAQGKTRIKFSHITDFICDRILQSDNQDHQLPTKWIPIRGHDVSRLAYLQHPPVIKGGRLEEVRKVWVGKSVYDKGKHDNVISQAYYSDARKRIYCLQSLADWIGVYTVDAKLENKIRPSSFKVKKDAAVLSIAFSERQERLGAILKDFSISFWDAADNFSFQKSITTAKYCQQLQTAIWYLQFFQKWVTGDMGGSIYIWNLPEQRPEKIMKCQMKSRINDLCEIPTINALAVVQQQKNLHTQSTKIQLLSITRGEILCQIDTKTQRRMLHTIRYSEEYQVLLSAGFQKRISLFDINTVYLDTSLKGELLGHQSAVTCFLLIKKTPMVVSADDKGKVKVWNIRNLKCMQTIDFTDKVTITSLLDLSLQNRIAALGSRITLLHLQASPEEVSQITPLKVKQIDQSFYVFTQKDLRLYNFKDGKIVKIDCKYSNACTETTSMILSKGTVITGNEKGQISIYNRITGKLMASQSWHLGAIQYLEQDVANNLLISASDHNGFVVSRIYKENWEELRCMKGNFIGKQLFSIIFSSYHSMIGFISGPSVFILDYQQLKIAYQFTFSKEETPTNICFVNGLGILVISTSQGSIHIIQIDKQVRHVMLFRACNRAISHVVADLKCKQINQSLLVQSLIISCSEQTGGIKLIDLTDEAKSLAFKSSKANNVCYNPLRQVRESFEMQLKKGKYEIIDLTSFSYVDISCKITSLTGHSGGVNSLDIGQFDQHLLISAGADNRIKVWLKDKLVGDVNVNRPLPYLWDVNMTEYKRYAKKMLQGIELIQAIFKRFGKEISIGESQVFKMIGNEKFNTERKCNTAQRLKKKPTLFQDQFNVIDLNYDKIKREKLLPINGPSLKRMEITKNVESLQKQWQYAKQKQDDQRNKLLKSIQVRAYKNQEKEAVVNMLRDRNSYPNQQKNVESSPMLKIFEEKLQKSIAHKPEHRSSESMMHSGSLKISRDLTSLRFSSKKFKTPRGSIPSTTFEKYFHEKYQGCQIDNGVKTVGNGSPEKQGRQIISRSQHKDKHFRTMLKEMREKLSKSKKQHVSSGNTSPQKDGPLARPPRFSHARYQSSLVIGELDRQIENFCPAMPSTSK